MRLLFASLEIALLGEQIDHTCRSVLTIDPGTVAAGTFLAHVFHVLLAKEDTFSVGMAIAGSIHLLLSQTKSFKSLTTSFFFSKPSLRISSVSFVSLCLGG